MGDDATLAKIVEAVNNNTGDILAMTSQNNALNQQIIRSIEREQSLERKVSRLQYKLAEKDVEIQYWKSKNEHRRTPQQLTHSNHHYRTPPFDNAASVPVHDTATINTAINTNNDIICDVDNFSNDDDSDFFMMDDGVSKDDPAFLGTESNTRHGTTMDGDLQFLLSRKLNTIDEEERFNVDDAINLVLRHAMAHGISANYLKNKTTPLAKCEAKIIGRTDLMS